MRTASGRALYQFVLVDHIYDREDLIFWRQRFERMRIPFVRERTKKRGYVFYTTKEGHQRFKGFTAKNRRRVDDVVELNWKTWGDAIHYE